MQRPLSITLFALLFGFAVIVSGLLALYAVGSPDFGFPIAPAAAETLIQRIKTIRLFGIGFAVVLMLLVVFARSPAARNTLGLRWILGFGTSVAFLRGVGAIAPLGVGDHAAIALSVIQLGVEGLAILLLYGEDAAPWFERRDPRLSERLRR
jgi:hypothetical protein